MSGQCCQPGDTLVHRPRLAAREPADRHRRPAQRRQVHLVQRADRRTTSWRRTTRSPPSSRTSAWSACPTSGWRELAEPASTRARSLPATVDFLDIAGLVRGASRGPGPGQQVPRPHPRDRRDLPGDPGVHRPRRAPRATATSRQSATSRRSTTELILADLQTLEKAAAATCQKEAGSTKDPAGEALADAVERPQRVLDGGTTLFAGAAAAGIELARLRELSPAHRQAVPLRVQPRRRRAG